MIVTIAPSAVTTEKKTDKVTPLANIYYICANGGTAEAVFPYGFINY